MWAWVVRKQLHWHLAHSLYLAFFLPGHVLPILISCILQLPLGDSIFPIKESQHWSDINTSIQGHRRNCYSFTSLQVKFLEIKTALVRKRELDWYTVIVKPHIFSTNCYCTDYHCDKSIYHSTERKYSFPQIVVTVLITTVMKADIALPKGSSIHTYWDWRCWYHQEGTPEKRQWGYHTILFLDHLKQLIFSLSYIFCAWIDHSFEHLFSDRGPKCYLVWNTWYTIVHVVKIKAMMRRSHIYNLTRLNLKVILLFNKICIWALWYLIILVLI